MIFVKRIMEPEGPVLLRDGSWLIAEMAPERECITHISGDGQTQQTVARIGRPNGIAVDAQGIIWVAQSMPPSLIRMTMEGKWESCLSECNGESFLYPNDLVFGPDGALYLTDSGIASDDFEKDGEVLPGFAELSYDGRVYRIDTEKRQISRIDAGLRFANGIAFGPDRYLYVNETISGNVYRYRWRAGTAVGPREYFGNVIISTPAKEFHGPDGMKFGADGNLYVAVFGQGNVTVLGRTGGVVARIPTVGRRPTNCAFGPKGSRKLYVTEIEFGSLEMLDIGVDGLSYYSDE